jgi:hypothetical protein
MKNGDFTDKLPHIEVVGLGTESAYRRRSDEEIKKLAIDILGGGVFTSWMIHRGDEHLVTTIFMPLVFLDDIERKRMVRDGVVHFYNSYSAAGPRSINGYPIFESLYTLDRGDVDRIVNEMKQIEEL